MKMTSAQAGKLLRQLTNELAAMQRREDNTSSFLAAMGEDVESVRPEYNYAETQEAMDELEAKIRKLRHTLNLFNTTTVIPEFSMTIDEMLVYLPQLSKRFMKLSNMESALPKVRENAGYGGRTPIIDYRYANYDIEKVKADCAVLSDTLAKAQTALDYVNNTVELEVEL